MFMTSEVTHELYFPRNVVAKRGPIYSRQTIHKPATAIALLGDLDSHYSSGVFRQPSGFQKLVPHEMTLPFGEHCLVNVSECSRAYYCVVQNQQVVGPYKQRIVLSTP